MLRVSGLNTVTFLLANVDVLKISVFVFFDRTYLITRNVSSHLFSVPGINTD